MPLLHWLTRDEDLRAADRVPYRLLDEEPELSHSEGDQGLLVQGDKALLQKSSSRRASPFPETLGDALDLGLAECIEAVHEGDADVDFGGLAFRVS